jgi:hypothetical protein
MEQGQRHQDHPASTYLETQLEWELWLIVAECG